MGTTRNWMFCESSSLFSSSKRGSGLWSESCAVKSSARREFASRRNQSIPSEAQAFCPEGKESRTAESFALKAFVPGVSWQAPCKLSNVFRLQKEEVSGLRTNSPESLFKESCVRTFRKAGTSSATQSGDPIGFPRITTKGLLPNQEPSGGTGSKSVLSDGYR